MIPEIKREYIYTKYFENDDDIPNQNFRITIQYDV